MAALHRAMKRSHQEMCSSDTSSRTRPHQDETLQTSTRSSYGAPPLSPPGPEAPLLKRIFAANASLLLIGVRGVGKSSLGFLAATAYSRRLIESDRAFSEATGSSRNEYRKLHGTEEYHRKHCEVLTQLLNTYGDDAVLVCSFADLENDGRRLIRSFAQSHPVVYVTRDVAGIQSYIKIWSEERIRDLIRASEDILRSCSNHEFFNVSELSRDSVSDGPRSIDSKKVIGPFLTLKKTEHDFLKLMRNVVGDHFRSRSHQSAYPLSQVGVETLEFTSAVSLTVEDVVLQRLDLDEAQVGVDAVQLDIGSVLQHTQASNSGKHSCFNLINKAFAILRRSTILPIVIASESLQRGAETASVTIEDLLEYCLRLAPEYCTLDLSLDHRPLKSLLCNSGRTKIIGEYTFLQRPTDGWENQYCLEMYQKAQALGCDMVKLTMPDGTLFDSFGIQALQQRIRTSHGGSGPPLIAYCMGKQGRTSMCFNNILTPVAPVDHTSTANSNGLNPLITAKERNQALFTSFVHEPMRFFIYGANVSFSLSPAMHNAAYKACGMLHTYRTHSASTMDDFVSLVREHDFGGCAVVQPFKTKAFAMMDVLSPQAKAIGALNTVIPLRHDLEDSFSGDFGVFRQRNRTGPVKALYGDNTDWIGIRACIRRGLSPANTVRAQTTGLVCGAGGMARAAIYAMLSLGVQTIFVCNRTKGNAEELATHYNKLIKANAIAELSPDSAANTSVIALESFKSERPKDKRHPTMIVSCIPTQTADGMPTNFELPTDWLSSRTGGVVVEMAYMPVVTPLVRQVQGEGRKGWILMDGLDMLPEQAFAQFELFTGRRAPRKLMRDEVFKHYSEDEFPPHGALNTDSPTHD